MSQRADLLRDAKILVVGIVAGLLLAGIGCAWLKFKPSLPSVLGVAPPKFADAKTEAVPCKTVQALLPKVKKQVGLPAAIQKDEQASVLAIAAVPRSDNPLFATAVLHRDTGVGEIYFTPQRLPLFGYYNRWRFGGYYGFNDAGNGSVLLGTAQYEAIQVKSMRLTSIMQVDSSGRWYGGIGLQW